jgi:hypothetical protein
MRRGLFQGLVAAGCLAALATGCGEAVPPTVPTDPTLPSTVETFSGVLTINGAITFPFSSLGGSINAKVAELKPDGATIGVSIGVSSGATCQTALSNDNAGINSTVLGVVRDPGTLCARVYDVGKLTEPATFTINVEHQ